MFLLHPCTLARRRRGSGAVSVRARGAPQSPRHLPAEGQRPRVDHGRGSTAARVSARGGGDRAGAGGCGGGAPRPHGPMTPAGPMPARSARSRPPPAAQREPVPGEVVGRDSLRGQPSPKFDAGRAGCKVAAATDSDGSRASGRRARAIWALLCARALSGGARALRSSVAAPDDARSTRRAAGGRPVPLGRASVARGASACTHSSSDPTAPARDQRQAFLSVNSARRGALNSAPGEPWTCGLFWLSMSSPTPAYFPTKFSGRRMQSVTRVWWCKRLPLSDQRW